MTNKDCCSFNLGGSRFFVQKPDKWSKYPAIQDVDLDCNELKNVKAVNFCNDSFIGPDEEYPDSLLIKSQQNVIVEPDNYMDVKSAISADAFLSLHQFQGFPQDTADITTMTGLPTGGNKWIGGVLASNGKIYGIPFNSSSVLIIDPKNNTADTTTISGLGGNGKWLGGVLAPNGKIYGIPYNSSSVLIIDPVNNTADTTTITGLPIIANKWGGGVLAPNGKIYGIPVNSSTILVIDPVNNIANTNLVTPTTGSDLTSGSKWFGGVLAPNGKIYGIPFNSQRVLIIDTVNNTFDTTTITGLSPALNKWVGGALAPNGKIYGIPFAVGNVLIIDPESPVINLGSLIDINQVSYNNLTKTLTCAGGITGNIEVGDNIIITTNTNTFIGYVESVISDTQLIFIFPLGININAGQINTLEKTRKVDITTITGLGGGNKWGGGVLAPNGKIYGIPRGSPNVLIIDPETNTADITTMTGLTSVGNKWYGGVLAPNRNIYGIPFDSQSVLQIKTSLHKLSPWMLQAYFNKF
jgi:hypothetical protein